MLVVIEASHNHRPRSLQRGWVLKVLTGLGVALLAWSWSHPITLDLGGHGLGCGYGMPAFQAYLVRSIGSQDREHPEPVLHTLGAPRRTLGSIYYIWWY